MVDKVFWNFKLFLKSECSHVSPTCVSIAFIKRILTTRHHTLITKIAHRDLNGVAQSFNAPRQSGTGNSDHDCVGHFINIGLSNARIFFSVENAVRKWVRVVSALPNILARNSHLRGDFIERLNKCCMGNSVHSITLWPENRHRSFLKHDRGNAFLRMEIFSVCSPSLVAFFSASSTSLNKDAECPCPAASS